MSAATMATLRELTDEASALTDEQLRARLVDLAAAALPGCRCD